MMKNRYMLVCITISLLLLTGCKNMSGSSSTPTAQNTPETTAENIIPEATEWKVSEFTIVNNLEGVNMTAVEGTITNTGLTLIFENNSGKQCIYGEYFCLEKEINRKWHQVPVVIENYGFHDIGFNLASGEDSRREVNWKWLYGTLNTGEYRIVKDILDFRDTGDYDKYYLAAEFTITEKGKHTDQAGIELDVMMAEYRALWKENYKYDTPILIDNMSDWKIFLSEHGQQSITEDVLDKDFNDDFFKHSVLYAYIESETSGSIELHAKGARLNEDKLILSMERKAPLNGTMDMAARICLFGVRRDMIKNVKSVEAFIKQKNQ